MTFGFKRLTAGYIYKYAGWQIQSSSFIFSTIFDRIADKILDAGSRRAKAARYASQR
jgi:hypothetical protein